MGDMGSTILVCGGRHYANRALADMVRRSKRAILTVLEIAG